MKEILFITNFDGLSATINVNAELINQLSKTDSNRLNQRSKLILTFSETGGTRTHDLGIRAQSKLMLTIGNDQAILELNQNPLGFSFGVCLS